LQSQRSWAPTFSVELTLPPWMGFFLVRAWWARFRRVACFPGTSLRPLSGRWPFFRGRAFVGAGLFPFFLSQRFLLTVQTRTCGKKPLCQRAVWGIFFKIPWRPAWRKCWIVFFFLAVLFGPWVSVYGPGGLILLAVFSVCWFQGFSTPDLVVPFSATPC